MVEGIRPFIPEMNKGRPKYFYPYQVAKTRPLGPHQVQQVFIKVKLREGAIVATLGRNRLRRLLLGFLSFLGFAWAARNVCAERECWLKSLDLFCAQCNKAWPGCDCAESEEQHAEKTEAFLSKHPSVIADRERRAVFLDQGGDPYSITAFRAWEAEQKNKQKVLERRG